MPNLAATLKEEIRRLARKEIKAQVGDAKNSVVRYRRDLATLKRQLQEAQAKIKALESGKRGAAASAQATDETPEERRRFSAKSVKKQRDRLGLSAKDYGLLVGVSGLTIYNWEHGKSRPRKAQLESLAAVRSIGKREAIAKLATLGGDAPTEE